MVREPHLQKPVLPYDSKRGCETTMTVNPPVSELDPVQRLMEPHGIARDLLFQLDWDAIKIDRFRSNEMETPRECCATVIQEDHREPSTASSESFGLAELSSCSTGVQNALACTSDSKHLRSEIDILTVPVPPCFEDTLSSVFLYKYRTLNFFPKVYTSYGRVHMLDGINRTVGDETSVENDDEIIKTRRLYQCKRGRVHMLNTGRTVGDETQSVSVNDSELFFARRRDLYRCKLDEVHMLDIDRTAEEMSILDDSELCGIRTRNLYWCKLGRVEDGETVIAVRDHGLVDIQLSDCNWTTLFFSLQMLLALISNSLFTSTSLTVVISLELFFSEAMLLFLLIKNVPRCSEKLHRCFITSVFNWRRENLYAGVLQKSLNFQISHSLESQIESGLITVTFQRSIFLPVEHPHSSTVKEHRQHLLNVCSVWYKYLRILLLSLLLSSSCLLLLLTLAKLRLVFKLWFGELKSHDVVYLLVVALLLVTWIQLIPAASLTRGIHEPVKLSSSKTITIIIVALSCYVNLTDSAPLHLPNLLIRGTAGGNGTYTVPLQGSPNTGYCARITIGLKPYPQEVFILIACTENNSSSKNNVLLNKNTVSCPVNT